MSDEADRAAKAMHNAADDYVGRRPHMDGDTERAFLSGWDAGIAYKLEKNTDKPREWWIKPGGDRSLGDPITSTDTISSDPIGNLPMYHVIEHSAYLACQRERDEIKARVAEIQYAAMKSGDTVRSLYAGSEVSKRILALREENDTLKVKLEVCVKALEEARNHAFWATAQVQIKDAYNCANWACEIINEALAKLKEMK